MTEWSHWLCLVHTTTKPQNNAQAQRLPTVAWISACFRSQTTSHSVGTTVIQFHPRTYTSLNSKPRSTDYLNYHLLSAWLLSCEFTTTGAVVLCLFSAVTTRQQRKQCSLYKGPFNASDPKPTRSVSKVSFPALLSVMKQFEIKLQIWWRVFTNDVIKLCNIVYVSCTVFGQQRRETYFWHRPRILVPTRIKLN